MKSSRREKEKDMVGIEKALSKTRIGSPKPAKRFWQCNVCRNKFFTLDDLIHHHESTHGGPHSFKFIGRGGTKREEVATCRYCNKSYTTREALMRHHHSHHIVNKKPLLEECLRAVREPAQRIAKGLYMCITCSNTFPTRDDYALHQAACVEAELNAKDKVEHEDEDVMEVSEEKFWLEGKDAELQSRSYALWALEYFNSQDGGKKYELVEGGPILSASVCSIIFHINFRAKEKDCPSAQVETFFAELISLGDLEVECCVSLGPSHELPPWTRAAYLGCCTRCSGWVNHPTERIDGVTWDIVPSDN